MALVHYSFEASALSVADREKLLDVLDTWSFMGPSILDAKNFIFSAFFEPSTSIANIPLPNGTVVNRLD